MKDQRKGPKRNENIDCIDKKKFIAQWDKGLVKYLELVTEVATRFFTYHIQCILEVWTNEEEEEEKKEENSDHYERQSTQICTYLETIWW